jgi:VWFA-related protein
MTQDHRLAPFLLSLIIFLSSAQNLRANPQTAAAPAAPPTTAAEQQPQVIHSATRLVQVTVVVQNKHGQPVIGLNENSFTLLDNGKPQKIAFFSANAPAPAHPHPLPANTFTNRADLQGREPGATTVILFDALNTSFEDQSRAREHVLRFLRSFNSHDHVAVFALTNNLLLLHGFTEDAGALANSVNRFSPRLLAAFDASHPSTFDVPALANDPFFKSFENHVNNANGEIADDRTADRFRITYAALEAIAEYVTTVPGHKSLVWVSGGIPIQIGPENIGVPDRDYFDLENSGLPASVDLSSLGRALNRANLAIYPVDAHGIDVDDSASGFFMRQSQRDTFRVLADKTGGKAFFGNNDIAGAIHSAFEDGRYTYTLGFYPDHGVWDGKFRDIKIHTIVEDAHLRYRRGYFAFPEKAEHETAMKVDLQQAAQSALDATDLGITLKGKPLPPRSSRTLQLQIGIDPRQFVLHDENNHLAGGLDLLFLQKDVAGNFLAAEKQHYEVNFTPKEYDQLAKIGMILQRRLPLNPASAEIRVLVRDQASGALGSVTVPVNKLL